MERDGAENVGCSIDPRVFSVELEDKAGREAKTTLFLGNVFVFK